VSSFDSQVLTDQARARLPLKRLLEQHGVGPRSTAETWSSFKCPFCTQKAGSVFRGDQGCDLFKCFYTGGRRGGPCPSANKVLDESGFLALTANLSRKDAWIQWLKEAGVWREQGRDAPSVIPGQKPRRRSLPEQVLPGTPGPSVPSTPSSCPVNPSEPAPLGQVQQGPDGLPTGAIDAPSGVSFTDPHSSPEQRQGTADHVPAADLASGEAPFSAQADMPRSGEEPEETSASADVSTGSPALDAYFGDDDIDRANESAEPDLSPHIAEAGRALREFYASAPWLETDQQVIQTKRGLLPSTCRWAGLKSSPTSNRELIESLRGKFSSTALEEAGLCVRDERGRENPNPKFYGWGEKGRKRLPSGERVPEFGWVHPVLIPYFDRCGQVVHLRPHRDMSKGVSPRLYIVRPAGVDSTTARYAIVVITEGEFKALALRQILPRMGVVAIPGVSMCRDDSPGTYGLVQELFAYLRGVGAKQVIVAFDNEDKSNPKLPSYKEDPRKRYDTQIWAYYLATLLERRGYETRVAWLPNAWRSENGKADWDGVLASMMQRGMTEAEIAKEFERVLNSAQPPSDYRQPELFDLEAINTIKLGVSKKFRKPCLAWGGARELKIAKKLLKCLSALGADERAAGLVEQLAFQYRDTLGGYYLFKTCLTDKSERELWTARLASARKSENWDVAYVAEKLLNGRPVRFTDFVMEASYSIQLVAGEHIDRIVRIQNVSGEVRKRAKLDSESFAQPSKFRKWLLDMGNFKWGEGEKELNKLQEDMNRDLAYRMVYQVAHFGWHDESKLWLFDDCAITPEGNLLLPDEDGIIWWQGLGYQLSQTDREGEEFAQGRPKMKPTLGLVHHPNWSYELKEESEDDPEAVRWLFQDFAIRLKETVGGNEAYMGLGAVLAFAVAPEFYARNKWFCGLWIHGERGSGKTTVACWLQRLFGLLMDSGMNLNTCTRVGMLIAAQQYCWLPLWFEEYRSDIDPQKVAVVRGLYNRDLGVKKEFGDGRRKILSNAIITGEATSHDSATRQRFAHLQVAESCRQANHLEWFHDNSNLFFAIGRYVLRHRAQFIEEFQKAFREWCESKAMKDAGERSKLVHGVAYAGFVAAAILFQSHAQTDLSAFRDFMIGHTIKAGIDVKSELNINVLWQHIIDAFKLGVFGQGEELRRYFKVIGKTLAHPPGAPSQGPWMSYMLYFDYNAVMEILREHLARQRISLPLNRQDWRDQLSKNPSWVEPPPGRSHKQRFGNGKSPTRCWCLNVDLHPMGYLPVSDEELTESRSSTDWADPRKGELFLIIHAAEKQEL